jgi:hypothetical protein
VARALGDGRGQGLAIGALALSLVSFVNLLGAEKSILAIVLGDLAWSASRDRTVRRRSFAALGLSMLHIGTLVVVLIIFHEKFGQLIQLLYKLG